MYRIFTEDLNRPEVQALIDSYFPAYTLVAATGCYKGTHESSLIVEITTEAKENVTRLAQEIKTLNHQESVLVTYQVQTSELI